MGGLASLTTDPSKLGTRFGMVCSILAFASLAGPPTAGALIQADDGGFFKAQVWAGTITIAGGLFIGAAKWSQVMAARRVDGIIDSSSSGIRPFEGEDSNSSTPDVSQDEEYGKWKA